jgi:hypothetical protein
MPPTEPSPPAAPKKKLSTGWIIANVICNIVHLLPDHGN